MWHCLGFLMWHWSSSWINSLRDCKIFRFSLLFLLSKLLINLSTFLSCLLCSDGLLKINQWLWSSVNAHTVCLHLSLSAILTSYFHAFLISKKFLCVINSLFLIALRLFSLILCHQYLFISCHWSVGKILWFLEFFLAFFNSWWSSWMIVFHRVTWLRAKRCFSIVMNLMSDVFNLLPRAVNDLIHFFWFKTSFQILVEWMVNRRLLLSNSSWRFFRLVFRNHFNTVLFDESCSCVKWLSWRWENNVLELIRYIRRVFVLLNKFFSNSSNYFLLLLDRFSRSNILWRNLRKLMHLLYVLISLLNFFLMLLQLSIFFIDFLFKSLNFFL